MARRENQKTKILLLLDILTRESDQEHPLSVPRLLQRLEENGVQAERKSIYSDIQELQELGYQIELKRGPGGGFYMAEGIFQLTELKLLVDAVQSSRFVNSTDSRRLIEKLTRLTSKYNAQALNRQVRLSGRAKTPARTQYALNSLHEAVNTGRMVSFVYKDWTLEKKLEPRPGAQPYVCSPAALTYENGQYYLIGEKLGEGRLKNFRVDKMDNVTVLEEKAVDYSNRDINQQVARMFNMFGGQSRQVTISAPDRMVGIILDKFGTGPTLVREESGRFHLTVPADVSDQFFGWVCGFGGDIRIEGPADVLQEYRGYLERLLQSTQETLA